MATSRVSKKASKHSKGTKKSSKSMKTKKTKKTTTKRKNGVKCVSPMPKDHACCLRCRKQTKMSDIKTKTTKNGRKQLVGMGECKHTVYRFA